MSTFDLARVFIIYYGVNRKDFGPCKSIRRTVEFVKWAAEFE